ncbi:MAG TPA: hypothetical protein VKD67_09285 [Acidimicrobiales bacterium]|nr:hypothetical protein [Acidimicrobiales bacterium]
MAGWRRRGADDNHDRDDLINHVADDDNDRALVFVVHRNCAAFEFVNNDRDYCASAADDDGTSAGGREGLLLPPNG